MVTLREALSTEATIVLDGGLSVVLADAGCDLSTDLWTAAVLGEAPEQVVAAHGRYFRAGAQVATTASYQASVEGFVARGLTPEEAEALLRRSVGLARRARDEHTAGHTDGTTWVAASIGPYGAALADGSEYRGDYGVPAATLRDFHARRLDVLVAERPDVLAVETVPDVREAEVLVPLLDERGIDAWFTYAVADGRTRAGQSLEEAFAVVAASTSVIAGGVNCSAPSEVLGALLAARAAGVPAGVAYPNQGRTWDERTHTWAGSATFDAALVSSWTEAGARLVGGCCEVGPEGIAAVADAVHPPGTLSA